VREVLDAWSNLKESVPEHDKYPEKLILNKQKGRYVGLSSIHDYTHRPKIYDHVSLYDWIRLAKKEYISKCDRENFDDEDEEEVQDNVEVNDGVLDAVAEKEADAKDYQVEHKNDNIIVEDDCVLESEYTAGDQSDDGFDMNNDEPPIDTFYYEERHEDINKHRFLSGHEQRDSYSAIMQFDSSKFCRWISSME